MINSANFKPQDPNVYAQQYANQKGITLEEAKNELKAQNGDPVRYGSGSVFNAQNKTASTSMRNFSDYFTEEDLVQFEDTSALDDLKAFFKDFMGIFKGRADGPQKEGDPQPY